MARSVSEILKGLIAAKTAETALNDLTSSSTVSIWRTWLYIYAVAQNITEQLQDLFITEVETIAQTARPGTAEWVQAKIFEFQYSAISPQALDIIDLVPQYPVIDDSLKIITRCSVTTDLNKNVNVKVAKEEPPVQLAALEESSLQGYLTAIGFAGITYVLVNEPSDKLYVEAEVYVDAQYFSTIQTNVELAINNYLKALASTENFDGVVKLTSIEDAIQSVTGVVDVKLITVKARPDAVLFANGNVIYELSTGTNGRQYDTLAGYITEETTAGKTFADSITYISQ